jgi:hypothetical protein
VREDLLNDRRLRNRRNDLPLAAAVRAVRKVEIKTLVSAAEAGMGGCCGTTCARSFADVMSKTMPALHETGSHAVAIR